MIELIKKFIDYMNIEKNYSKYTTENYQKDLEQLDEFLKLYSRDVKDLDRKLGREYLVNLYKKGYKSTTIARKISSIKSFYKFLIAEKLVEKNNFLYIRLPKKDKNIPIFLSQDEIFDLLNAPDETTLLGQRDRALIEILYSTGIRISELINIRFIDIDLFGETIKVFGKGRKERIVPIGTNSLKVVKKYIDKIILKYKLELRDFLFRNYKNGALSVRSVRRILSLF